MTDDRMMRRPNEQKLLGRLNIYTMATGDGRDIELAKVDDTICWRRVGDVQWKVLVSVDDLRVPLTEKEVEDLIQYIKDQISDSVPISAVEGLEDILDQKADIVGEIAPNTILVTTNNGALQCSGLHPEDIVTETYLEEHITEFLDSSIATEENCGSVKSSSEDNSVSVDADGTMEVNQISVDKLVNSDGFVLILNGGSAPSPGGGNV